MFFQEPHVLVGVHGGAMRQVFGQAADFDVAAPSDNNGMKALRRLPDGAMGNMDKRTSCLRGLAKQREQRPFDRRARRRRGR